MSQLTHSPFLQALGYAIINSLWQFALLWLVYVFVNAVLKLSPHQKYNAGLLLQFGGFFWFAATFNLYFRQYLQLAEISFSVQKSLLFSIAQTNVVTSSERYFAYVLQIEKSFPYLSVAYLLILIFSGIKWLKAYNLTMALRTCGLHKIEVNRRLFVKRLSAELNIKREVKIYLSEMVKTPLTIGFFKPLILIPLASLNHLNTDQMEAVILHELAHIKRCDYLFNLLLAAIESILFFNPFMLLISKHIKRERENCCDDWVLQYNYNAASYAHALLQIATTQSSAYLFALKATDNKKALLHRIRRMIEKKEIPFFNYKHQLIALLVVITVLGSLAILSSRDKANNAAASALPQEIILQKMMFKSAEPANRVSNLSFKNIKLTGNNKQEFEKTAQRDLYLSTAKTQNKNTHTYRVQIKTRITRARNDAATSADMNETFAEDFKKDTETRDVQAAEIAAADIDLQKKQLKLAEEKFQLAVSEFQKNEALYNQKKFAAEMNAAAGQIKAAKKQLELAGQLTMLNNENHKIVSKNQTIKILLPLICNAENNRSLSVKLQLQIEEAKKKYNELSNLDFNLNYNLNNIQALYNLPSLNNTHSFSFEFSEKPKVKLGKQRSFNLRKSAKRNMIFIEDENEVLKNIAPPVYKEPRPEVKPRNKVFYTISI